MCPVWGYKMSKRSLESQRARELSKADLSLSLNCFHVKNLRLWSSRIIQGERGRASLTLDVSTLSWQWLLAGRTPAPRVTDRHQLCAAFLPLTELCLTYSVNMLCHGLRIRTSSPPKLHFLLFLCILHKPLLSASHFLKVGYFPDKWGLSKFNELKYNL